MYPKKGEYGVSLFQVVNRLLLVTAPEINVGKQPLIVVPYFLWKMGEPCGGGHHQDLPFPVSGQPVRIAPARELHGRNSQLLLKEAQRLCRLGIAKFRLDKEKRRPFILRQAGQRLPGRRSIVLLGPGEPVFQGNWDG